jgi:hypothetical protein
MFNFYLAGIPLSLDPSLALGHAAARGREAKPLISL